MTGWQPADGHGPPMYQQNNEVMELSRVISQLAMANHQLASAHNATLARMEALYHELTKERECRKRAIPTETAGVCDDVLRKRLRDDEPEEERSVHQREDARRLEQRVVRLEALLATSCARHCNKQRDPREDERLRSRIERPDSSPTRTRDTKVDESSRSGESRRERDVISEPLDDRDEDRGATREGTDARGRGGSSAGSDNGETNVPRIDESRRRANVDLDRLRRKRAKSRGDEQDSARSSTTAEEILRMSEEIERLKADRLERQDANERLLSSLTDRENLVEKLSGDYEVHTARRVD